MMTSVSHRGAAEIGSTPRGPRPMPPLGEHRTAVNLSHVDTVLQNGLRVLAVRKANVPLVEIRVRVPFAGDDAMHTAAAEVLAETLFTGTSRRNRIDIDTELSLIGGELNAEVDPEFLTLAGRSLSAGFPVLLDVLADSLTQASYVDGEVARESARLIERITISRSQPGVVAREALQRHRYGNHPAAREVPQAEDVAAVTAERVRQLHADSLLPRGSTMVVVGDIDLDAIIPELERVFLDWASDRTASVLPPLPMMAQDDVLLVPRAGATQSQIRLATQAISRTDNRYAALQLANLVFAGSFSSRLVENIREDKGYTYSAHSGFDFTGASATLNIAADTAGEVTAPALREIRNELARMTSEPPTPDEIESARQYAIGSLLIGTSSQAGLAGQLSAIAPKNLGMDWLVAHPAKLAAVQRDEIIALAEEFFAPDRFTGVVVGDLSVTESALMELGGVRVRQPE